MPCLFSGCGGDTGGGGENVGGIPGGLQTQARSESLH